MALTTTAASVNYVKSSKRMSLYASMTFDDIRSSNIASDSSVSLPFLSPRDKMVEPLPIHPIYMLALSFLILVVIQPYSLPINNSQHILLVGGWGPPNFHQSLAAGENVQRQDRDGSRGKGIVVVDVFAPADTVFDTLCQFSMYEDMIPTVRSSSVISRDGLNTAAAFTLSRFQLRVNVVHRVFKEQRIVKFRLDDDRPNLVFEEAIGFWHVQAPKDRPEGWSRVYLSACILTNVMIPPLIMDYAASRALTR